MPFETTPEKLLQLVTKVSAENKYNTGLVTSVDIDEDASEKEALFTEDEVKGFYEGLRFNFGETRDNIEDLKEKLGFQENETMDVENWISKSKLDRKLGKEEARRFFFQRLLLDLFKDEELFFEGNTFNEELHNTSPINEELHNTSPTVVDSFFSYLSPSPSGASGGVTENDTKRDLWLFAKFNELKEEKKIPEGYQYKSFVGLVRKSIKAAASEDPKKPVTTETILNLLRDSAIKIQAKFRGFLDRKKAEDRKKAKDVTIPAPVVRNSAGNDNSALADEIRKMQEQLQKVLDGAKSSDPTRGEWQADGTRNVTYQYLVDNDYVSNGENYYLIPEIKGRKPVTQYNTGLPVFNYKDLNEFSQDAAEAGKEEWNKKDNHLLSSIVCIGEGEDKRYCVVTSSVRGVTKTFISQTEFNKITSDAAVFYEVGLESAIKTTALDETLEVLNSAKKHYEDLPDKEDEIKTINNEIAAIKVRKTYMSNLMTKSDDFTAEERLSRLDLYNNLDIALPETINFTKEERTRFEDAKSRTVVADDSYNTALEVVLKMDAAYEIDRTLKEAKTRSEDGIKALRKEKSELAVGVNATEIDGKIAAAKSAIDRLTQFIENNFDKQIPSDDASFLYKKNWSLTTALKDKALEDLHNNYLSKDEIDKIKKFADKAIDRSKDEPQDIAKKLIAVDVDQIDRAQDLVNKEFDIKTGNRKEKLEKALDKEKEAARHSASCSYSHQMAKMVERSIENEMINGLDTFEVKSIAEDFANAHAKKAYIYGSEDKEAYAKNVRKLLKSPVPHTNVNGVGFHRPRGTSIVSVAFNYSEVGHEGELTGNTEAYPYIDGSYHCYIGCRVCKKDGMKMTVLKDGKAVADKEYKRGDTVIDQNTISFLDPKTQKYTHVEASPAALNAYLESMKRSGNPYPGSVESIMAQYKKMQIKVTSQVNNATAKEPDIERKVSIMHKGKILSYNAENSKATLAKKKVVTKAIDIKDGEIVNLIPGFNIDKDKDRQRQFVKMNIIKVPNGDDIDLYVKLSTNADGKVIHESEPYCAVIDDDGRKLGFYKLTSDLIKNQLQSGGEMDEGGIEDEAAKLFNRAVTDCGNTKLILPLGITGEAKGKKYKISTPNDFAGVGRGGTDNKPSPIFPFRGKKTESKAIKLEDVNKLATVPEGGIVKRVNQKGIGR